MLRLVGVLSLHLLTIWTNRSSPGANGLPALAASHKMDPTDPGLPCSLNGELCRRNWCLASGRVAVAGLISSSFQQRAVATDDPAVTKLPPPPPPFQVAIKVGLDSTTATGEIIVIEVIPEWAPLAAKRFEELVEDDFFTGSKFFRVLPGYVAQFGISGNPELNKKWLFDKSKPLPDEPRLQSNKKGTLSFASSGRNSRQTQIFINLSNNDGPPNFLDAQGFVPFARVVRGMDDVVPKLYNGYGMMETASAGIAGSVNQAKAAYYGNEYLEAIFPKLSTIQQIIKLPIE